MTSTLQRRLDTVAGPGLTARERARLVHRAWIEGEQWDERLVRYIPPEQRAEYDRLTEAIEQANRHAFESLSYRLEWTFQLELRLAWLRTLAAYQDREAFLLARLPPRKKPLALPPLPPVTIGIERDLPLTWGALVGEPDFPSTWEGVRKKFEEDTRTEIELRWREQLASESVLSQLNAIWGEEAVHVDVRRPLLASRKKLLQLHVIHQEFAGEWPLPAMDPECLQTARQWVQWEDLKDTTATAWDPRKGLTAQAREELETQEAEWADELRD